MCEHESVQGYLIILGVCKNERVFDVAVETLKVHVRIYLSVPANDVAVGAILLFSPCH